MSAPLIPVFRDKFARGWPEHASVERKERATYATVGDALARSYTTDAHFAGYSVPAIDRRLAGESVFAELPGGASMVLFVGDIDRPDGIDSDAWWEAEQAKLDRLEARHPGLYAYRTRGGYRFVYVLAVPFLIASAKDKAHWSATYNAWLDYLAAEFEIVGDRACHDWTRFYRLPFVVRDNKRQLWDTLGDPHAIGLWSESVAPAPADPAPSKRSSYTPGPGAFDIDAFMSSVAPDARQYQQRGRRCWDVECPNEANHSTEARRDSVVTITDDGPTFHCLHDHCADLHWADFRKHHDPSWVPFDERPPWVKSYEAPRPADLGEAEDDRDAPADDYIPPPGDLDDRDAPPPDDDAAPPEEGKRKRPGPRELAKRYIGGRAQHRDGVTLRRWRGDWYRWTSERGCYAYQTEERIDVELWTTLPIAKKSELPDVKIALAAMDGVLIDERDLGTWIDDAANNDPLDIAACCNGLLHLPTGKLTPATPRYFSTSSLGVAYDAAAPTPERWLAFLRQLWPHDRGEIEALQEWIGYLLTPDTRQQKIALVVGPKRSGKGTIARIVTALLGGNGNVASPTLASLGTNFGLWPLIGKSAAIIGDARLGARSDIAQVVERLLSISGEDGQTIDRKHREPWTGKLPTRITIISNELPRFSDASDALPARMLLLELTESFYGKEDTGLTDALLAELPGILLWAIAGWRRLRARGHFVQPESSKESIDELADLASPVGAWARQRCTTGEPDQAWWLECKAAYDDFARWCEQNGHHKPSIATFGRDVRASTGCQRRQVRRGTARPMVYAGLALRSDP